MRSSPRSVSDAGRRAARGSQRDPVDDRRRPPRSRRRVETANAALDVVSRRLEAANPRAQKGRTTFALGAHDDLVGEARTPLFLLLASVGCVLLIACLNIGNLLLARAVDRQKEIALRAALGASRGAVARQLAVEATMLAAAAAALGLVIGQWTLRALVSMRPAGVSMPASMPMDARVLLFTLGSAVLCAIVCGLAPALRALRANLVSGLQGRRATGGSRLVRDGFVVAQVALCVSLIAVSGLLVESMLALQRVRVGFDRQQRVHAAVPAAGDEIPHARGDRALLRSSDRMRPRRCRASSRRHSCAGCRSAATGATRHSCPKAGPWPKGCEPRAGQNIVTPDYFKAMRIPVLRGRDFSDRDALTTPPVAVINETFARTIWPDDDPIGKRVTVPDFHEPMTVVGVVGDVKHRTRPSPRSRRFTTRTIRRR